MQLDHLAEIEFHSTPHRGYGDENYDVSGMFKIIFVVFEFHSFHAHGGRGCRGGNLDFSGIFRCYIWFQRPEKHAITGCLLFGLLTCVIIQNKSNFSCLGKMESLQPVRTKLLSVFTKYHKFNASHYILMK